MTFKRDCSLSVDQRVHNIPEHHEILLVRDRNLTFQNFNSSKQTSIIPLIDKVSFKTIKLCNQGPCVCALIFFLVVHKSVTMYSTK